LWKNFDKEKLNKVIGYADLMGFPLSKLLIVIILFVILVFIVPLNLLS